MARDACPFSVETVYGVEPCLFEAGHPDTWPHLTASGMNLWVAQLKVEGLEFGGARPFRASIEVDRAARAQEEGRDG